MSSSRVHRGQGFESPANSAAANASHQEDRLISLIEAKNTIQRYEKHLKKMEKGTLDVPGFMKVVAIDAAIVVADVMFHGENDKVRLEAAKDVLDRAGHSKTQKVQVGGTIGIDHDTSKLELINLILSSARRAGVKVQQEEPVFQENKRIIDVTPVVDDSPLEGLDEAPPEGT